MTLCLDTFSKTARFADLMESVQHCNLCPRLCERRKVLSEANGSLEAKVLFVAEAPGRLGADRTGVPLLGDKTGENFENLLGNVGWRRDQVFITNAVLCNPRDDDGTNGTPTLDEVANCSAYLEMVIALVKPEVVVTLGATALKALHLISSHGIQLQEGVAKLFPWYGYRLFPLYHPAPRAVVHRSLSRQRADFMTLARIVHPEKGLITRKKARAKTSAIFAAGTTPLQQVARAFLELGHQMTYFKLTKLLYLFDLAALRRIGHTFASEVYLRQIEGPWPPKLDDALGAMDGYEVRRYYRGRMPIVALGPSARREIQLDDDVLEIVADVFEKWGALGNSGIKTVVYRTDPMRFIMEEERKGKDMRNKAVIYKDKTAAELAEQ